MALFENPSTPGDDSQSDKRLKMDLTKTGDLISDEVDLVAFFDAYDDGSLDILVSSKSENGRTIDVYQNLLGIDATWIKAMVYTGFCGKMTGACARCSRVSLHSYSSPVFIPTH